MEIRIKIKDVYRTPSGRFLQVVKISDSGLHHFIEVEDNIKRNPIQEQRNKFGHVTRRVNLVYTEEIIATFKKLQPI